MADALHQVVMAAAEVQAIAPVEFGKLVLAIREFEEQCRDELQAAAENVIFPAQGRAQVITKLRQKLENCHQLRSNYEQRQK